MNEIKIYFSRLIEERSWIVLKQELNNLESFQIAELIESLPK